MNTDIEFSVDRTAEEGILRADFSLSSYTPSIEDSSFTMSKIIEKLAVVHGITKIIFYQKREYEYDYHQTSLLNEIARIYSKLIKDLKFGVTAFKECSNFAYAWYTELKDIIFNRLPKDPLGAFVELKRIKRREKIILDKSTDEKSRRCIDKYITTLDDLITLLENTKLMIIAAPYVAGYEIGDRSVYRKIFTPTIKPNFMYTKLMASYPKNGKEIDSYTIKDTEITVFKLPDTVQTLYHVLPPELKLSEEIQYRKQYSQKRIHAQKSL